MYIYAYTNGMPKPPNIHTQVQLAQAQVGRDVEQFSAKAYAQCI